MHLGHSAGKRLRQVLHGAGPAWFGSGAGGGASLAAFTFLAARGGGEFELDVGSAASGGGGVGSAAGGTAAAGRAAQEHSPSECISGDEQGSTGTCRDPVGDGRRGQK
jgi:hypothetical protein